MCRPPGETPGHQLLHVQTDDGAAYITGDLYHHVMEFDEPGRNVAWAERQTMQASKARLMAQAQANHAQVYFAHIEGAWRVTAGRWVQDQPTPAPSP